MQRTDFVVYRIELLCQGADSTGYLGIVNRKPGLKAMKHAAKLRELSVYANRLQPDATDTLALVVWFLMQHVIFGAIKFVSERFGHARNGVSELVDDGIEKRHSGRKALSTFNCPPIAFDRMRRALSCGYQHALSHDETQSHEIFAELREFLMQIRYDADNLVSQNIEAQVSVRTRKDLPRQIRDRGMLRDPCTATRIRQAEVQPDPTGAVLCERGFNFVLGYRLCCAIGPETVRPDNAGGGGGIG